MGKGGAKKRRRYSDDERASALAALAANDGNLTRTAKALNIPKATLEAWAKGVRHPEASESVDAKKGPLADAIEGIARQIADSLPGKLPDADLKDAAVAFGVLVDKMQLLRGKPTDITKHDLSQLSADELRRRLEDVKRRRAALGGGVTPPGGSGPGEVRQ